MRELNEIKLTPEFEHGSMPQYSFCIFDNDFEYKFFKFKSTYNIMDFVHHINIFKVNGEMKQIEVILNRDIEDKCLDRFKTNNCSELTQFYISKNHIISLIPKINIIDHSKAKYVNSFMEKERVYEELMNNKNSLSITESFNKIQFIMSDLKYSIDENLDLIYSDSYKISFESTMNEISEQIKVYQKGETK